MSNLTNSEVTQLFLAIGILLAVARLMGEVARRFHQPAVIGEILAGIILGPTILGRMAPDASAYLFPSTGGVPLALEGLTTVAIALFLVVAGMEVDLSTVWRQGRAALVMGFMGLVVPFILGFTTGWLAPESWSGESESPRMVFALFLATALAISSLPVVAKTLMDLNLYRSDLGMIVVAAAILNDLIGWIIFAILLGMIETTSHKSLGVGHTILLTFGFTAFILTIGRWFLDRALPWIQAHTSWPGGVLGFALSLALLSAAFTEWIGIHAIFGSFLFGVALGDSRHLRERTRAIIDQFISFIFAPLFFASISLRVDMLANFDWLMALILLVVATAGKVLGCGLSAKWSQISKREAWAIGFGMNARGVMQIILGLLGYSTGVIGQRMFVSLVIVALITSMTSGTLMQRIMNLRKALRFTQFLSSKAFLPIIKARDRREAIQELAQIISPGTGLGSAEIAEAVWSREQMLSTGLAHGVAIPHARVEGLSQPFVAVGISRAGVDFDAVDGQPAHLILMLLTPRIDNGAQVEILADITRTFRTPEIVEKTCKVSNYTEFLALIRSDGSMSRSESTSRS